MGELGWGLQHPRPPPPRWMTKEEVLSRGEAPPRLGPRLRPHTSWCTGPSGSPLPTQTILPGGLAAPGGQGPWGKPALNFSFPASPCDLGRTGANCGGPGTVAQPMLIRSVTTQTSNARLQKNLWGFHHCSWERAEGRRGGEGEAEGE